MTTSMLTFAQRETLNAEISTLESSRKMFETLKE
jgi:hypothetical protein